MKLRLWFAAALVAIHALVVAQPLPNLPIPEAFSAAVSQAEASGKALALAVNQEQSMTAEEESGIRAKISDVCDLKYKVYKLLEQDRHVYYMVAQPPAAGAIVFGRHFKVAGDTVTPSTKTCFVTPPGPPGSVGAMSTHLLSESPTEFHVYLSLLHDTPIFVGTSYGAWMVAKGKVSLMQRRR
jgi:hypothetical protein